MDGTTVRETEKIMLEPLVRIVDDDESLRGGLSFVLRMASMPVQCYESAEEFLSRDDSARPGCVVLDIRMAGMSGLECQQEMRRRGWTQPVLFLTGHGDAQMAVRALKQGAADFLQKPVDAERFVQACSTLVDWHRETLRENARRRAIVECVRLLSEREREVARQLARGSSNKEIASAMGISEQGVKFHRSNIYRKLNVRTAVEIDHLLKVQKEFEHDDDASFLTLQVLRR